MIHCDHSAVPRASSDARDQWRKILNLFGIWLCWLIPLVGAFLLQVQPTARLTNENLGDGLFHTLWTGHLLHYTFEHFLWDASIFVVLAILLWKEESWRIWGWLLISTPLISITVFLINPQLTEYRGLSALATLLYTRYCLGLFNRGEDWRRYVFGLLPLAGLLAKISYEFIYESTLFVSDLGPDIVPLPQAHLGGFILGAFWIFYTRFRSPDRRADSKFCSFTGRFRSPAKLAGD